MVSSKKLEAPKETRTDMEKKKSHVQVDGSADHDEGQKRGRALRSGVPLSICKSRKTRSTEHGCLIETGACDRHSPMPTGPWTVVWVAVPGEDWTMLGSMDVMDRGRPPPTTHLGPCLTEQEKWKLARDRSER